MLQCLDTHRDPDVPLKKILIVEDEPTLLATLRYSLEREGYAVATAADGELRVGLQPASDRLKPVPQNASQRLRLVHRH